MGYEKDIESKIIRITHKVTFYHGTRNTDLLDYLINVPRSAVVRDFDEADDGAITITFLEEQEHEQEADK